MEYSTKTRPADDPEAFLTTFEQAVEAYKCPQEAWAVRVSHLLTEEPQVVYWALGTDAAQDYKTLKAVILD